MAKTIPLFALLLITLTACSGYKTPSLSGDPAKMSADTLCYRAETNPGNEALASEAAKRGLDCASIVENDPLYIDQRY